MRKNGRKPAQTEKVVKAESDNTSEWSTKSEPGLNSSSAELEARLRRLEASHVSRSSSDVYKFAFFFFMGVALTIILYPKVSSSINSVGDVNIVQSRNLKGDYVAEQLDEVDDTTKEGLTSPLPDERANRTLRRFEVKKEEESSHDQSREDHINHISDTENDNKKKTFADKIELENKPVGAHERTEDLMIGETEENDNLFSGQSFKFVEVNEEDETVSIKEENEPQTIELFSENIDDIARGEPIETPKLKTEKKDTKPMRESTKGSPKKANKNKAKQNKKEKKVEDNAGNDDPKLPKEIRDFKPTFQKTLTPKKVFIDGRRIPPMELLPQKPNNSSVKIWLFEEFLSENECDNLMRVHKLHVEQQSKDPPILCFDSIATLRKHLENVGKKRVKVTPMDFTQGTTCVNASFSSKLKTWLKGNWSYSTAFYPGESQFASVFEQRVKQAMGLLPENGGKFQITSYPPGIGYKSHTDCTEDSDKRDRVATVLVYLDTVSEGGETDFPELGIWARPRKGRALLWNNMDPDGNCEPMSIHKANKVLEGHKYILQRWYYYQSFYSLGKRPPEPSLPQRNPGQPRVSCDEYEHGSCRWYDEWNFEHVIDYERKKYTLV